MKSVKKILKNIGGLVWSLVQVIVIVYVIAITMCILCKNKFGYTQFDKYTLVTLQEHTYNYINESKPGDLLVVKSTKDLNVGDVIYYYINIKDEYVVKAHPIKAMTAGKDSAIYVLDDEFNTSVASTKVLGKYANVYEGKGKIIDVLTSRIGFLFLVLLPILVIFIYQIYEFIIVVKFEKVDDEDTKKKKKKIIYVDEDDDSEEVIVVRKKDLGDKSLNLEEFEIKEKKNNDDVELL